MFARWTAATSGRALSSSSAAATDSPRCHCPRAAQVYGCLGVWSTTNEDEERRTRSSSSAPRLFALVRRARWSGIDPDETLRLYAHMIRQTRSVTQMEHVKTALLSDMRDPRRFLSTAHCLGKPSYPNGSRTRRQDGGRSRVPRLFLSPSRSPAPLISCRNYTP
jgi:hypothetical protein